VLCCLVVFTACMFASFTRKLPSSCSLSRPSERIVLPSGVYCLHFAKLMYFEPNMPSSCSLSRPSKRVVLPSGVYCLHFAKLMYFEPNMPSSCSLSRPSKRIVLAAYEVCQRFISRGESEAFAKHTKYADHQSFRTAKTE